MEFLIACIGIYCFIILIPIFLNLFVYGVCATMIVADAVSSSNKPVESKNNDNNDNIDDKPIVSEPTIYYDQPRVYYNNYEEYIIGTTKNKN